MPQIALGDQIIAYSVRRSSRAKRISIRFDVITGFVLVCPRRMGAVDAEKIIWQKREWILNTLSKTRQKVPFKRQYVHGGSLPFMGREMEIVLKLCDGGSRCSIQRRQDRFEIAGPSDALADEKYLKSKFESYYLEEAQAYLPRRTKELASLHGFSYGRVTIRNQKTRWGSCSVKGNLNLNLRLMMAPPSAIDSVIIHELCHLREMNHSPAFWDLVYALCPDYDTWKTWFKENTPRLVF